MKITQNPDGLDEIDRMSRIIDNGGCIEEMGLFRNYQCTCSKCINKLMHTNFNDEIEAAQSNNWRYTFVDFIYHAFIVVVGIVLALCIADLIFGAEEMAEVQGEVVYQIK